MAEREVVWKALADFSSIVREANRAKKALLELNAAQNPRRANAQAAAFQKQATALKSIEASTRKAAKGAQELETKQTGLAKAMRSQKDSSAQAVQFTEKQIAAFERQAEATGKAEARARSYASTFASMAKKAEDALQTQNDFTRELKAQGITLESLTEKQEQYTDAIAAAKAQQVKHQQSLDDYIKKLASTNRLLTVGRPLWKDQAKNAAENEKATNRVAAAERALSVAERNLQEAVANTNKYAAAAARTRSDLTQISADLTVAERSLNRAHENSGITLSNLTSAQERHADVMKRVGKEAAEAKAAEEEVTKALKSHDLAMGTLEATEQRVMDLKKKSTLTQRNHTSALLGGEAALKRQDSASRSVLSATNAISNALASRTKILEKQNFTLGESFKDLGSKMSAQRKGLRASAIGLGIIGGLIPSIINLLGQLGNMITSVTAGFMGMVGTLASASGVLGALPGLILGVGSAVGVLFAALYRTVSVVRLYTAAQKQLAGQNNNTAKTMRQNARQIRDAEDSLAKAQKAATKAQQDLTKAREDARQKIVDLRKEIKQLALDETASSQAVEEARLTLQQTINDPGSTDLQRRQAALAVQEAEARLADVRDAQKTNQDELDKANKQGIDGSDDVVSALENQKDAADAVLKAQENLSDVYANIADAADNASSSMNQYNAAMKKLTPEGQAVVLQLIAMGGALREIQATAERGFLPGVLVFLKSVQGSMPILNNFVKAISQIGGNLMSRLGKSLGSGSGLETMELLFKNTIPVVQSFANIIANLITTLTNITVAAGPMTTWLAQTVEQWTAFWAAATGGTNGGALTKTFNEAQKSIALVGRAVWGLVLNFFAIAKALKPLGDTIFKAIGDAAERWLAFNSSVEGQNKLKKWGDDALPVLTEMIGLIGDVGKGFMDIFSSASSAEFLKTIRSDLGPAIADMFKVFTGPAGVEIAKGITHIVEGLAKLFGNPDFVKEVSKLYKGVGDSLNFLGEKGGKIMPILLDLLVALFAFKGLSVVFGPVFSGMGKALDFFFKDLGNGKTAFAGFKATFQKMVTGLTKLGPQIIAFFGRLPGLIMGVLTKIPALVANPWFWLVVALIAAVVLIVKYWDQIKTFVINAVTSIGNFLKPYWEWVVTTVLVPLKRLWDQLVIFWNKLVGLFQKMAKVVSDKLTEKMGPMFKWLSDHSGKITGVLKAIWDTFWNWFIKPIGIVLGYVFTKLGDFFTWINDHFEEISAVVLTLWNGLWDLIFDPVGTITRWITKALQEMSDWFVSIISALLAWVVQMWPKITEFLAGPIRLVSKFWDDTVKGWQAIFQGFHDFVRDIFNKIYDVVRDPINMVITGVINPFITGFNGIASKIPGVPTFGTVPELPKRATGGYLPGTQNAAGGGLLRGPGTGTSDSILGVDRRGVATARVSNKEFVVNAKSTRKHFALIKAINDDRIPKRAGGGMVNYKGGTFTSEFARRLAYAEQLANEDFRISQGGFRPATSYSGTSHAKDAVDITSPVNAITVLALRSTGIAAWDRTGKGNWAPHIHGVPLPGAGEAGGSAVWQAQDYLKGGDGLGGRDTGPRVPVRSDLPLNLDLAAASGSFFGFDLSAIFAPLATMKNIGTEFLNSPFGQMASGFVNTIKDSISSKLNSWFGLELPVGTDTNYGTEGSPIAVGASGRGMSKPSAFASGGMIDAARSSRGYARGTNWASPGYRWVGERGPELMHFSGGESVHSTQALANGGLVLAGDSAYRMPVYMQALQNMVPGMASKSIQAIQKMLALFDPTLYSASQDGIYNSLMSAAIRTVQQKMGISPTNDGNLSTEEVARLATVTGSSVVIYPSGSSYDPSSDVLNNGAQDQPGIVAGAYTGFFRTADGSIYGMLPDGSTRWISYAEWTALGGPMDKIFSDAGNNKNPDIANSLSEQMRSNALSTEFNSYQDTFTAWGLDYLVEHFAKKGASESLSQMRDFVKSRPSAKAYDEMLKASGALNPGSDSPAAKRRLFIAAVANGDRVGLQGASRAAGVSLDTGAAMFDSITADGGWGSISMSKLQRLVDDVSAFKNLFKFARFANGGYIPGSGNGDTTPLLGMPGEFILRKAAAQQLGPEALSYLNNIDRMPKFSAGGFIGGYSAPSFAGVVSATSAISRSADTTMNGKSVTNEFKFEIHNPVAEKSSVSTQKAILKLGRRGLLEM